jgi:hypothetical protein
MCTSAVPPRALGSFCKIAFVSPMASAIRQQSQRWVRFCKNPIRPHCAAHDTSSAPLVASFFQPHPHAGQQGNATASAIYSQVSSSTKAGKGAAYTYPYFVI